MVIGYLERSGTSAWLNTLKSNNLNQFIALRFVAPAQRLFLFLFSPDRTIYHVVRSGCEQYQTICSSNAALCGNSDLKPSEVKPAFLVRTYKAPIHPKICSSVPPTKSLQRPRFLSVFNPKAACENLYNDGNLLTPRNLMLPHRLWV